MNRWAKASTAVVAAMVLTAAPARAQSANIQALANVFSAITVSGTRDLDFGNVFPGTPKTVATSAATSGTFSATGTANADVNMSFTLPTDLVSGGDLLPIGTWTGCHDADNTHAGCTTFTPSAGNTAVTFSGAGELFVWIGATVTPAVAQPAGAYAATVTITLAYF